jgi:cobalamin biosynthesis protein CbiG
MTRQLRGYGDNLRDFARVVAATDEQVASDMTRRQQAAERLAESIAAQTPAAPAPTAPADEAGPDDAPTTHEGGEER